MDNIDKLMKEIKSMDKSKRNELLDTLEASLSDAQKQKLKSMLSAKSGKEELKRRLQDVDINKIVAQGDISEYMNRPEIKKKIDNILG